MNTVRWSAVRGEKLSNIRGSARDSCFASLHHTNQIIPNQRTLSRTCCLSQRVSHQRSAQVSDRYSQDPPRHSAHAATSIKSTLHAQRSNKTPSNGTSVGDESIRTNQFLTYFSSILIGKIEEQKRHNLSLCNMVPAQRSRHCVKHRHQVKNPKRNEEFQKTRCHYCKSRTKRLKCEIGRKLLHRHVSFCDAAKPTGTR